MIRDYFTNLSIDVNQETIRRLQAVKDFSQKKVHGVPFPTNPLTRIYHAGGIQTTIDDLRKSYWQVITDEGFGFNMYNELPERFDDYIHVLEQQDNRPFLRMGLFPEPWGLVYHQENPRKPKQVILAQSQLHNLVRDLEKSLKNAPC